MPSRIASATDTQTPEDFRSWLNGQGKELQRSSHERVVAVYGAALAAEGVPNSEVSRRMELLIEGGSRLESDFWNGVFTSPTSRFNTAPNAFLAEAIRGRTAGRALDAGMGQGRNSIFLAQNGWEVAGFDPAWQAVALARRSAAAAGVHVDVPVTGEEGFDWGRNRWDLIAACYVPVRAFVSQIVRSLKPGGIVVTEGFLREPGDGQNRGFGVVFDSNELLHLFEPLRVLRYEDTLAIPDFGSRDLPTRVVRLCGQRP